jgi:hypothetical protein
MDYFQPKAPAYTNTSISFTLVRGQGKHIMFEIHKNKYGIR